MIRAAVRAAFVATITAASLAACSASDATSTSTPAESFVSDIRAAAAAVDAALGGPQDFFEITATPQLTNVFVAVDGATAAVPYVYLDGELQDAAPTIEDVSGQSFTADAIDFDESSVLSGVTSDLPGASIDAFSVEGGPGGFVRYVISARSDQGGVLDVVVAPTGAVIEVNPL